MRAIKLNVSSASCSQSANASNSGFVSSKSVNANETKQSQAQSSKTAVKYADLSLESGAVVKSSKQMFQDSSTNKESCSTVARLGFILHISGL